MTLPTAIIAMPNRGYIKPQAAQAFFATPTNGMVKCEALTTHSSILEACFNTLWIKALNMRKEYRPKYFAMLHDDVCPEAFWLDKLIAELEEHDADVMSAIVPIKDLRGLTSTAVGDDKDIWSTTRRVLTMTEVMELPETIGREDLDWPTCGPVLMPNTGCWVCRFDQPWVEEICFRNESKNIKLGDEWVSRVMSEDWLFGYDIYQMGLKAMATRKVKLHHENDYWVNDVAWGEWDVDKVWEAHNAILTS